MSWTEPVFEAIAALVGRHTGLAFGPARQDGAELGIRRAMTRANIPTPAAYLERLAGNAGLLDDLLGELTVGETYFFRESGQFQQLRQEILPEIRKRRGPNHVLRAWSAGCASGEEPYSLAILLAREGLLERSRLLATDIARAALGRARQGVYGSWSLRGEWADAVRPFLFPAGGRYQLSEAIRRSVTFEYLNLALDAYPSFANGTWGMDLVLCRNVLIYLDPATVRGVARRLCEALAPGGWLLTAASDPPLGDLAPWDILVSAQGVFYRRRDGPLPRPVPEGPAVAAEIFPAPEVGAAAFPETNESKDVSSFIPPERAGPADPLAEARRALADGDYVRVVRLTEGRLDEEAAAVLHVRALANLDAEAAGRAAAAAAAAHRTSAELSYLQAVLLLEAGKEEEAVRAVRRVLYLDRTLAVAHFTLGTLLLRRDNPAAARRAFRNARALCAALPPDRRVPLADGETAGRLAEAMAFQMSLLEAPVR